jgi:hypothetical protein
VSRWRKRGTALAQIATTPADDDYDAHRRDARTQLDS